MYQVEFTYNGIKIPIQCNENDKMSVICQKFVSKTQTNKSSICFSYGGKSGYDFNEELSFIQMANKLDKEQRKMNVLANDINEIEEKIKESKIQSKDIICPECGEIAKIGFENYKISIYDCKNGHEINNLSFDEFDNSQKLDLSTIICQQCKENNKNNTYNKTFYRCFTCDMNICPFCREKHDKNHNIINYEEKNYICSKHNEKYSKYCTDCKINICILCKKEHLNHHSIYLEEIIQDQEELKPKINELKENINKFQEDINKIICMLNKIKDNINLYYTIIYHIIYNYNIKNRNYEILFNLKEIFNNDIVKDINKANIEYNISNKFNNLLNIYDKIKLNEIKLTLYIGQEDINKDIYFLDNTDGIYKIDGKKRELLHDNLQELNESNTELFVNYKKYKYRKYFRPEKEGYYLIKLKLNNIKIKDCSFMFCDCYNIINIDLSSFDTSEVNNMYRMFNNCIKLNNINLSNFNTQNVSNMGLMFNKCINLKNINLSEFNTKNVSNMDAMFSNCNILETIDLSSFDTTNLKKIVKLFSNCKNLTYIDISSFICNNVKSLKDIFEGITCLKKLKISKVFYEKIIKNIGLKEIVQEIIIV